MRRRVFLLLVGLVGALGAPSLVFASRCNQVTVVTDAAGGSETRTNLSTRPARVCAVEFIANGANGFALVYDSPDNTLTNSQMVPVSEPGASTSNNSEGRWYGEDGRPTRFGLDVEVVNGTAIILWAGTP